MKITIATLGTHGDVQPYVALGMGLKEKGHFVTINTCASFEPFITSHGLKYGYLNDDLIELIKTEETRETMENLNNIIGWMKMVSKMMKLNKNIQKKNLEESWECLQKTQPDLIIFHPKAYWCPYMADLMNIPAILAVPLPVLLPTKDFPFFLFPNWKLGGWYNKMTHRTIYHLMKSFTRGFMKKWYKKHKYPLPSSKIDTLHNRNGEAIPVLNAFSQHVVSKPADWPEDARITGYWFLDEKSQWQPSCELLSFLNEDEAPVYVGFGSMAGKDPSRITKIVIDALQQANVRGILASGWGGLAPELLPETIFMLDRAPHDWLFPRVKAVIHHGGAGTTAAGLRAGKPTVICPFLGDQPFWGKRVFELGVGSAPIPQKKLTVENLASAILEVTTNQKIIHNAEILGQKIRNEDGVANAIDFIEQYMKGMP